MVSAYYTINQRAFMWKMRKTNERKKLHKNGGDEDDDDNRNCDDDSKH